MPARARDIEDRHAAIYYPAEVNCRVPQQQRRYIPALRVKKNGGREGFPRSPPFAGPADNLKRHGSLKSAGRHEYYDGIIASRLRQEQAADTDFAELLHEMG